MIKVHFFAQLRERLECSLVNLEYDGEHTVEDVKRHLIERGQHWELLNEQQVLVAVNQTICALDARINDGDEIAFFPPVTGG